MTICERFEERLLLALDEEGAAPRAGAEAGAERAVLEQHAAGCVRCAATLRDARALEGALRELGGVDAHVDGLDVDAAVAAVRSRIAQRALRPVAARLLAPALAPARGVFSARRVSIGAGIALAAAASLALAIALSERFAPVDSPAPSPAAAPVGPLAGSAPVDGAERAEPSAAEVAEPLEPERLAATRASVREHLLAAAQSHPPAEAANWGALAADFDRRALALVDAGWPIERSLERLAEGTEPDLALAAIAWLGTRGGRLSERALRRAQERPATAFASALALARVAPRAVDLGLSALDEPGALQTVLERMAAEPGPESAEILAAAARDPRIARSGEAGRGRIDAIAAALARLGPDGVRALLELAAEGRLERGRALALVCAEPSAADALLALVDPPPARGRPMSREAEELLVAALGRAAPADAVPWLEERARDTRDARGALSSLAAFGGAEALAALVRLRARGWTDGDAADGALAQALERDPLSAAALVERLCADADEAGARDLFQSLAETAAPEAVPGLIALAACGLLPEADRRSAALLAGEHGSEDDVAALGAVFQSSDDPELCAALLVSIHAIGGKEACAPWLARFSPERAAAALDVLARAAPGQPTTTRFRVLRQLAARLGTDSL